MKAERLRPGIWSPRRVHDRPGRVQQAARTEQDERDNTEHLEKLRKCDHGDPPERKVAARHDGARCFDPPERERYAGRSARPGDHQNRPGERAMEQDDGDRGEASCDEPVDRAVVDPLQQGLEARMSRPAVIERAADEQRDEARTVDAKGDGSASSRRARHDDDGRRNGHHRRDRVRDAAQPRHKLNGRARHRTSVRGSSLRTARGRCLTSRTFRGDHTIPFLVARPAVPTAALPIESDEPTLRQSE